MKKVIYVWVFVLIAGCSFDHTTNEMGSKITVSDNNTYHSLNDTLHTPFDTNRVIQMLDIEYSKELSHSKDDLDTLTLRYKHYACDCPHWIRSDQYDQELPSAELSNHSYYVEAKDSNIEIDERVASFTNEVVFIGELRTNNGLPQNLSFTDPEPIKGNIFVYYSYKIVPPITVYGPKYHTGSSEIPGDKDELIMPTHIKIKLPPTIPKLH